MSTTSIQSSRLLVPEARAALARATRDRRLSPGGATRALDLLRTLFAQVEPVELDASLAERAGELASKLGLRGGDAVHLASYELVDAGDAVLVTADGDLARAALSQGHAVAVTA
jgi:predicted nucleic acid-binding protein